MLDLNNNTLPITENTKTYSNFAEFFNIIQEAPLLIPDYSDPNLEDLMLNKKSAEYILSKHTLLTTIKVHGVELKMFRFRIGSSNEFKDCWIGPYPAIFVQFYSLHDNNGGCQFSGVWQNHKMASSMARELIFNFYLEHYSYVISDKYHTGRGVEYWKKLVDTAIQKGYRVTVLDTNNNTESEINNTSDHYGSVDNRFKIYSK